MDVRLIVHRQPWQRCLYAYEVCDPRLYDAGRMLICHRHLKELCGNAWLAMYGEEVERTGRTDQLEERLRRVARRRGLQLQKSHSRNEDDPEYGMYRLVDPTTNAVVAGGTPRNYSMTLTAVGAWLGEAQFEGLDPRTWSLQS